MDTSTPSLNTPAPGQVPAPRMHKGSLIAGLVGGGLVAAALIGITAERGEPKPAEPVAAAPAQTATVATVAKPQATETVEAPKPAPKPVVKAPPPKAPAEATKVAAVTPPVPVDPAAARLARLCDGCALVERISTEERRGDATMLGTLGGAVVGGLLGNQVGNGSGRKVATVGGAVAGGFAGREIEKNMTRKTVWVTEVTFKDGSTRSFEQAAEPNWRREDVVELREGRLVLAR